ncbi:NAD(P)/FAD-dependent oxidoreductase [Bradyrhizobium sp. ERR14]|uniref:NAD(P)/FAD-dependent oxidoreductase n=1 Tax=Bradyrhizobium sp. ERR14 TaxID=2663837 RepID=UPI00160D9F40|nr:FAD-dependent oxidoreductase [Bradyrhizobium sp. ERR14]MBB4398784.1 flavin-dependent dehydrogenase [Bradyrhizobium sp. ERR14]
MTKLRVADIAVIGAGPAGCAAAIGLARAGCDVVLCDRERPPRRKPGEIIESRVRVSLGELGIEVSFDALNSLALAGNVSSWDGEDFIESDGMTSPYGLGVLVDRSRFEAWLISEAERAGVAVISSDRQLHAERSGNRWCLSDRAERDSRIVVAPLVIQATGRAKGPIGPCERTATDRLVALLMYGTMPDGSREQNLLIEAGQNGWWYAAPLPHGQAVVAFLTDADFLPRTWAAKKEYFRAQLAITRLVSTFSKTLPTDLPLVGHPANSGLRHVISGEGWVCIGEAAASYDPLSGRGVPLALAKGTAMARLIVNGENMSRAFEAYEQAERATFEDYLAQQRLTYRRAAPRFSSAFWTRRGGRSANA